jgi:hypothetical protein
MKPIYLVAYYFQKPRERVKTQIPGWMKNADNISWDEQVALTRNLKNRDITQSKVILDLVNQQVIKNGWNDRTNFDELYQYYERSYPQYTRDIMKQITTNKTTVVPTESIRTIDTSGTISST